MAERNQRRSKAAGTHITENKSPLYTAYMEAVEVQLTRLTPLGSVKKRRQTILALAEAEYRPDIDRKTVFARSDTVSASVFYNTQKSWFHDPIFRDVLENVLTLTRRYHTEKVLAQQEEERLIWIHRMKKASGNLMDRVDQMLTFPLITARISEDGQRIIEPAKWHMGHVAQLMKTADEIARTAMDMPVSTQRSEITGAGGGPITTASAVFGLDGQDDESADKAGDRLAALAAAALAASGQRQTNFQITTPHDTTADEEE